MSGHGGRRNSNRASGVRGTFTNGVSRAPLTRANIIALAALRTETKRKADVARARTSRTAASGQDDYLHYTRTSRRDIRRPVGST